MFRKTTRKSPVLVIVSLFALFPMFSCVAIYHGVLMKGSIIDTSNSDVYLCIGSKDGAAVGQELNVYKVIRLTRARPTYTREYTGKVKITKIIDEHFAEATVISRKAEKNDIVELTGR